MTRALAQVPAHERGLMPQRIQRQRTKGWRMPPGAVYCGRPTKWGNPFVIGGYYTRGDHQGNGFMKMIYIQALDRKYADARFTKITDAAQAVDWYRWYLGQMKRDYSELRGKDLACWCPLDGTPCHVDVLLEVANEDDGISIGGKARDE